MSRKSILVLRILIVLFILSAVVRFLSRVSAWWIVTQQSNSQSSSRHFGNEFVSNGLVYTAGYDADRKFSAFQTNVRALFRP